MSVEKLEQRVKELEETKLREEAEALRQLQAQKEAEARMQKAMQGQPPEQTRPGLPAEQMPPDRSLGTNPTVGGSGHPEVKPGQKDTEINPERIEARDAGLTKPLSTEGQRRMQGRLRG